MSSTISTQENLGITVLVPNGSMREKMLSFLRAQGFVPDDAWLVDAFCEGDKYAEGNLGQWQKEGAEPIEVLVQDRRSLPRTAEEQGDDPAQMTIALTCNDMVLNTWLCLSAEGKDVGESVEDVFRIAPLPVTSGRNGGDARWAMLIPKDQFSDGKFYPESNEITVLSELPLLALSLANEMDGRIGNIFEIQGTEEARLKNANETGLDTVAVCVVESGRSAEAAGLAVVELMRVQTKVAISERAAAADPCRIRDIEQMFGLPSGCLVLWPDFEKRGGLVTVVMQDEETGEILMVAYANEVAYRATLQTGIATFWSTSRNELWAKGATSGNVFDVQQILMDCDGDALVYRVKPRTSETVACHTGERSCFYREVSDT